MQPRNIAALICGLALVAGLTTAAYAQSISECQALITALRVNTEAASIEGKNAEKDFAGLVGKLNEAALKLDQAKFCDAIIKLNDYKARVQQLASAGRLTFEAADQLTGGADKAITCIVNLTTSAGIACAV